MKYVVRIWLVGFTLAAVVVLLKYLKYREGIEVAVSNVGKAEVACIVHVTGHAYDLGRIGASKIARTRVEPTSESHLEIEIVDTLGDSHREKIDCYFEPDYYGKVCVDVDDGRIVGYDVKVDTWP